MLMSAHGLEVLIAMALGRRHSMPGDSRDSVAVQEDVEIVSALCLLFRNRLCRHAGSL